MLSRLKFSVLLGQPQNFVVTIKLSIESLSRLCLLVNQDFFRQFLLNMDLLMFNTTFMIIAPPAGSTATHGKGTLQPKSSHLSNQSESTKAAVLHKLAKAGKCFQKLKEKTKCVTLNINDCQERATFATTVMKFTMNNALAARISLTKHVGNSLSYGWQELP